MKLSRLSLLSLLFMALVFTGCKTKTAKELLVNKWKLTEVSGEGAKDMSDAYKKEMTDKLTMELTKDGKLIIIGTDNQSKTGTYTASDDGKTLMLLPDGDKEAELQTINELKEGKLVITSEKEKLKLSFSPK